MADENAKTIVEVFYWSMDEMRQTYVYELIERNVKIPPKKLIDNQGLESHDSVDERMIIEGFHDIATGDFQRFYENRGITLSKEEISALRDAESILGIELTIKGIYRKAYITQIKEAFMDLIRRSETINEITSLVDQLPEEIKYGRVDLYLEAYCRSEDKTLDSLLPCGEDENFEDLMHHYKADIYCYKELLDFLNWVRFDILEEINEIMELVDMDRREYKIIKERADGKTLEQAGRPFRITRERARQLEAKVRRKFWYYFTKYHIIDKMIAEEGSYSVSQEKLGEYFGPLWKEILYLIISDRKSSYWFDEETGRLFLGGKTNME